MVDPVSSGGSCTGIKFSLDDFEYSEVCGKVIGYQVGSPDGFSTGTNSIDTYYVDGISLTHGSNPRKHIWTFVAGQRDKHMLEPLSLWFISYHSTIICR